MASISKITIDGFKAFPNRFGDLNLNGKNLLLYGENGSGKSSIYYALHCLLQSQVVDKSAKYFDPNDNESLVNKETQKDDAFIEVQFADSDVKYRVSKTGYEEIPFQAVSILRDLNGECVFINHKFLFHFFSFRNSQFIDLFPIFIKDILPFILTQDKSLFISQIYNDINRGLERRGTKVTEEYQTKILRFNEELKRVVNRVNSDLPQSASSIYNKHFRDSDNRELRITLLYEDNHNNIPQYNTSYWLRLGYRYHQVSLAGILSEEKISTKKELLQPVICLKIEEKHADATWKLIEKPQSYFNEAKLTSIALSIRFSLVDTANPVDGSFMALDDMLISLDMSNRSKVIEYLLNISDKYKVYLFTHDRVFFEHLKERIFYFNKAKNLSPCYGWVLKELYNNGNPICNPKQIDSESDVAKALKHYNEFDYPACANYLRKALERLLEDVLPSKLLRQDNGDRHEKLRNTLDASFFFFQKIPEFELSDITRLIGSLNLLLNPLSHKSTELNIYKTELKEVFTILERIKSEIISLELTEVYPRTHKIYMFFQENEHITQKYEIELKSELYIYKINGVKHIYQPDAKSVRSCTFTDGVAGDYVPNSHFKGNLEKICQKIHSFKKYEYANNYIDFYKDENGTPLSSLI